jgi:cobaltochelatase CobN
MKTIAAIINLSCTPDLSEAARAIQLECGPIVNVRVIEAECFDDASVSMDFALETIMGADLVMIDARAERRLTRELSRILRDYRKTVVVLVAANAATFALIRMGPFRGDRMFNPDADRELSIRMYRRTQRFAKITKYIGTVAPIGMALHMKNWIVAQQYYTEGGLENMRGLLLFY